MHQDLFQSPDYYAIDELLTEEHRLVRSAVRDWVKKEISPIIDDCCQRAEFRRTSCARWARWDASAPPSPWITVAAVWTISRTG